MRKSLTLKEHVYRAFVVMRLIKHHKYFPVDLSGTVDSPMDGFEISGEKPFLINFDLTQCRILRGAGFPVKTGVGNPFVDAICAYQETGDPAGVARVLSKYYRLFQPRNAGQLVGLSEESIALSSHSPYSYFYPWEKIPAPSLANQRIRAIRREDVMHGSRHGFQGWHHFGPVGEEKVLLEARRLIAIYASIKRDGLIRRSGKDGDIEAIILEANRKTCALITRGHHRVAALAVLGWSKAPIRLNCSRVSLVRRSEVDQWQGVGSDGFTKVQALRVFDRIFSGSPHPMLSDESFGLTSL